MSNSPRIDNLESSNNLIINGAFDFWQRGITFAAIANTTYTADRFQYIKGGTVVHTIESSTDVPTAAQSGFQSQYSLKVSTTTADATLDSTDFSGIRYNMEGFDYSSIHSQTVTLSFWVKSNKTGTYSLSLSNSANNRSYVTSYVINQANVWEKKSKTITLDASGTWLFDSGAGLRIKFLLSVGSSLQASPGTWVAGDFLGAPQVNFSDSNTNVFNIAQINLTPGSSAGAFKRAGRNIQQELAMCQRYFHRPAFSDTTVTATFSYGFATSATVIHFPIQPPVPMRSKPTFGHSGAGGLTHETPSGAGVTASALSISASFSSNNRFTVISTVAAATTNATYLLRRFNSATQYIEFDSEL